MEPITILVALLFILVVALISKRRKNLPPVYGKVPVIGCFPEFSKNPVSTIRNAYEKLGDCFTLSFFGIKITCMIGPEAQSAFFRAGDEELSPKEAYKFMVPVFGPGVVYDSPQEVMLEQLRFVKNGLVVSQLRKAAAVMADEARHFFETKWGDEGEADLLVDFNKLTILTASRCLMGEDIRRKLGQQEQFAQLYHDLEAGINPISFFFPYLPLPSMRQRDRARAEIATIFREVIQYRRSTPDSTRDDILQVLLDSKYKDGSTVSDEHMIGIMIGLLFAGQHTSSITATWLGLMLHNVQHKQFLDEVLAEQAKSAKEFSGDISYDYVKGCVQLENSIREVLRMFPPLIILMRMVKEAISYKEFEVPVGHLMAVSPGVGMRLPSVFTNPDKFDPHRFDRGEDKTPFSIISFGGGKHGCPGENFGILQVKTIWSVLFQTYNFEIVSGALPQADYAAMVVGPKAPCKLRYWKKK
eukprot:TRINITY_DN7922_c0_g1_i1.p1 TRINITY_DN7922_c0_g1~~TRINITY_DN7922_c0_g1_i1.p1  ORF type:complete len:512 (+),score=125.58 TRINITY_DN7922_c0_g1_i1:124-1536(+)